jgi:hypothetical protein
LDGKGEAAHQRGDMYWRRWKTFVECWGVRGDPFLDQVSENGERLLLARGFLVRHRLFKFDPQGRSTDEREKPVVSATLRDAISSVASSFRKRGRPSPFHLQDRVNDTGSVHPRIRALLRGFEAIDDPPKRQKAVTPALLRDLVAMVQDFPEGSKHAADLIVGAYFFAMRACEFCTTRNRGRTKILTCGNVTFRDKDRNEVPHSDAQLGFKSAFVTICFVDQKNGTKMERRSQRRSGVPGLCPVEAWSAVIHRIQRQFPEITNKGDLPVCSYKSGCETSTMRSKGHHEVSDERVRELLRSTCQIFDGVNQYGISAGEIGTRSIRSGAAMALAVQGGQSERSIMMLGRWKSLAFLVYIRPQVLEWAGDMSCRMANTTSFLDVGGDGSKGRSTAPYTNPNNAEDVELLAFPLFGV